MTACMEGCGVYYQKYHYNNYYCMLYMQLGRPVMAWLSAQKDQSISLPLVSLCLLSMAQYTHWNVFCLDTGMESCQ